MAFNTKQTYGNMEPKMMPIKGCPATEKMKFKCNSTPSEKFTPNDYQGSDMMMFMTYKNENDNQNAEQNSMKQNTRDRSNEKGGRGNQQSGNQQSGNQQSGNQQSGNQQSGNQQSGNQQSGNQQPGNQQPGNQQPGNQQPGNQQPDYEQQYQQDDQQQGNQQDNSDAQDARSKQSKYYDKTDEDFENQDEDESEEEETEKHEAYTQEEERDQNDFQNQKSTFEMTSQMKAFDQAYASGDFENFVKSQNFKANAGQCKAMNVTGCPKMKTYAAMGMGYKNTDCPTKMKKMAKEAAEFAAQYKCKSMTFMFPPEMKSKRCMEKFMEEFYSSCTAQNSYFSNPEANDPYDQMETVYFTTPVKFQKDFEKMNNKAMAKAEMTCMAQQMATAPPNYCNPTTFANAAAAMAQKAGMEFKCYDQEFMEKEKMGGMMAVSKGSNYPAKFFHMSYKPSGKAEAKYAFMGCGMTFDSGGYNMKHGEDMDKMKYSMSGAAACMAAAYYTGKMQPPKVQADFFMFAAENMVSSKAFKPGDVYTTYSGKTVEAKSTDCAAAMAMCDATSFAVKNTDAEKFFEFSNTTDTFAQAFGTEYAAMFSSDKETMMEFYKSATRAGEKMMPTPFYPRSKENYSETADYSTTPNTKYGKASANASFMKVFAEGKTFTHVEMTGPCYNHRTNAGTGFGAATCAQYMEDMSEKYCKREKTSQQAQAQKSGQKTSSQESHEEEKMYQEKQKEANKENAPSGFTTTAKSFFRRG